MTTTTTLGTLTTTTHSRNSTELVTVAATQLTGVLRLVARRTQQAYTGCYTDRTLGLIYWPHILLDAGLFDQLCQVMFTPGQAEDLARRDGHSAQRDARGQHHATFVACVLRHLRERVERLLAPLTLPHFAAEHRTFSRRYAGQHSSAGGPIEPLFEDRNYTVFRLIRPEITAATRVLCLPPVTLTQAELTVDNTPGVLLALLRAWDAVVHRADDPFDPTEVGIDFAATGHLFVNWVRFSRSRLWPAHLPQFRTADELLLSQRELRKARSRSLGRRTNCTLGRVPPPALCHAELRRLPKYCSLKRHLVDVNLQERETIPGVKRPSLYLELCHATGAYDRELEVNPQAPIGCTLVDPIALLKKELFLDECHARQYAKNGPGWRKAHTRTVVDPLDTVSHARVFTFAFRPAEYLDDFLLPELRTAVQAWRRGDKSPAAQAVGEQKLWPFPLDTVELIYAVKKRGALCFIYPPSLGNYDADREIYNRALDSVFLIDDLQVYRQGSDLSAHLQGIKRQPKSQYLRVMKQELLLLECADAAVRECVLQAGPEAQKQLALLEDTARRNYNMETGETGRRWFLGRVLPEAVKRCISPDAFRYNVRTHLPVLGAGPSGTPAVLEGATPRSWTAFTPLAIGTFARAALASMRNTLEQRAHDGVFIPLDDPLAKKVFGVSHGELEPVHERLLTDVPGSAIYLLAWARFCQAKHAAFLANDTLVTAAAAPLTQHKGRVTGDEQQAWTPAQDVYLLTMYHKYPRLTTDERTAIRRMLGRPDVAWQQHVVQLRTRLRQLMNPSTYQRLRPLEKPLSSDDAKRAVMLYGLDRAYRARRIGDLSIVSGPPAFRQMWRLSAPHIHDLALPVSYHDTARFFELADQLTN